MPSWNSEMEEMELLFTAPTEADAPVADSLSLRCAWACPCGLFS